MMVNFYDCFVIDDCNAKNATTQDVVGKTVKFCQVFLQSFFITAFFLGDPSSKHKLHHGAAGKLLSLYCSHSSMIDRVNRVTSDHPSFLST